MPADVSADPEYRERFVREADLAAKLWRPNIVAVRDRGKYEGQLWQWTTSPAPPRSTSSGTASQMDATLTMRLYAYSQNDALKAAGES